VHALVAASAVKQTTVHLGSRSPASAGVAGAFLRIESRKRTSFPHRLLTNTNVRRRRRRITDAHFPSEARAASAPLPCRTHALNPGSQPERSRYPASTAADNRRCSRVSDATAPYRWRRRIATTLTVGCRIYRELSRDQSFESSTHRATTRFVRCPARASNTSRKPIARLPSPTPDRRSTSSCARQPFLSVEFHGQSSLPLKLSRPVRVDWHLLAVVEATEHEIARHHGRASASQRVGGETCCS